MKRCSLILLLLLLLLLLYAGYCDFTNVVCFDDDYAAANLPNPLHHVYLIPNRSEVGFIRNSTLSNVRCKYIEAENCVLINVTAERIIAKSGSIIYNYIHDGHESKDKVVLEAKEKDVIVGIFDEAGRQLVVRSHLDIDGGKVWDDTILGNQDSFAAIHSNNMQACPIALQQVIGDAHNTLWTALANP